MNELSKNYKCFWVDETNKGVWSHAMRVRARERDKAIVKETASNGTNFNLIMAISSDRILHSKMRMGSFKKLTTRVSS